MDDLRKYQKMQWSGTQAEQQTALAQYFEVEVQQRKLQDNVRRIDR